MFSLKGNRSEVFPQLQLPLRPTNGTKHLYYTLVQQYTVTLYLQHNKIRNQAGLSLYMGSTTTSNAENLKQT